jgi:uncharacterized iron-regulated membrane protein
MRVPQVNERVKEAPAQALRAMFAGIGQLLLFTDKLRNRGETDEKKAPEAIATGTATATPGEAPTETAPAQTAPATTHAAPAAEPASAPRAPAPKARPVTKAAQKPAKAPAAAARSAGTAELPLPNYDELTVASLRARLRNLTADQLTALIGYEKAHANREEIIAMFQRRIAKLAEG